MNSKRKKIYEDTSNHFVPEDQIDSTYYDVKGLEAKKELREQLMADKYYQE